jgi:hypothetical protein
MHSHPSTSESAHAQSVPVGAGEKEFYPPHPPRKETSEYRATHKLLINVLDQPCHSCGVRKSKLLDPTQNRLGSKQMETHHYPVQREYIDAVDWHKVAQDFKQVIDRDSLVKFVDSPANMLVLCDVCHRSTTHGIHHLLTSDWLIEKYLFDGYVLIDAAANAQNDILIDNEIVTINVPLDEQA